MSVINQMLKELDQRNAGNSAGNNVRNNNASDNRFSTNYTVPESRNHFKKIVTAIVVILILVSVYYFKFMHRSIISEREQQSAEHLEMIAEERAHQSTQQVSTEDNPIGVQQTEQKVVFEQTVVVDKTVEDKAVETPSIIEEQPRVVKSQRRLEPKAQAERLYKSARQKLDTNQYSDASVLLEQAIAIKPDFHNARILQFSILLQHQQFDSLRQQVDASLQLWPEVHEYRLMKARLLLQQGLKTEALVELEKNIPLVTSAPEYHALLAYAAQQTQHDQLAKKHYQLLLQQQTNRSDWWLGLAVSEEKLGNTTSALKAYEHAVDRQGLSPSVLDYARQRIKVLQGF